MLETTANNGLAKARFPSNIGKVDFLPKSGILIFDQNRSKWTVNWDIGAVDRFQAFDRPYYRSREDIDRWYQLEKLKDKFRGEKSEKKVMNFSQN